VDFIAEPAAMAAWSARARQSEASVGFVPTMGALHQGHLDLVHRALAACDKVVCSIFVNPLQFNNAEDLARYPRQLEEDRALLAGIGCHAIFAPTAAAVLEGFKPAHYDLHGLDRYWEGPSRPGHFQGMVNIVERLFHYVRPDKAFFGEKDRQQLTIIKRVAHELRWPEHIVPCPTVREPDGLALSSRNMRLSAVQRQQATVLHRALQAAAQQAFRTSMEATRKAALEVLATEPVVVLDHFGIAHPQTLDPLEDWNGLDQAVALIAAQVGPVRLIDNVTLQR
jgi:pantoate--beta-alanine ligase